MHASMKKMSQAINEREASTPSSKSTNSITAASVMKMPETIFLRV